MPKTLTELAEFAAELSATEQRKLARILLELSEVDAGPVADVQEAWDIEIEHRLQELRTGKVKGVPLDEVRKRMESRFRA